MLLVISHPLQSIKPEAGEAAVSLLQIPDLEGKRKSSSTPGKGIASSLKCKESMGYLEKMR